MTMHGRISAGALALLGVLAMPAQAMPVTADWGLSLSPVTAAIETELRLEGTPYGLSSRLGAMGLPYFASTEMGLEARGNWWTTWGHYTKAIVPHHSVSGLVGLSQSWFFKGAPIPFRTWYSSVQYPSPFVGASYQVGWNGGWLRVTPTLTWVPNASGSGLDFWEASVLGPPLVEAGFRLDDRSEWRLRTSLTPFVYVRTF